MMVIGDRLRELRDSKELSQGDIEKRTGLLRCYISRVENGHTVPAIETLEKLARALEVPMYQLFHEGEAASSIRNLKLPKDSEEWGSTGKAADYLSKLRRLLAKMEADDQKLLLHMAQKVARH
jgi:transcriptional regulator with XRE-family HTH domain